MDIHEIRQKMKVASIYDIPMRVTFYARVSSEKDEQLNSLDNQVSYYTDLIKSNKNWSYVDGYIDEGISGISTQKRENFHRMISDAKLGMFDFIITKEISRFARNTLDSIKFTRELLNDGVGVFFQNDNINTLDEDSELRLTIMSGIAQDELRKLSSRIKFGHQQAIKNKVVIGNSRIFGYKKDNKKLVIDPEEAAMVRELFTLYATDQYSMKQIEDLFWAKGYRNLNGNKIAHSTMSNIISNPKYKGYYCGNKVKVIDMFTKKQKFLEPEEWVMFKDETGEIVPAIVSEELWDKANAVLARRSHDVKNRQNKCNHANLLTGKLFCTHCGKPFYRRESKDKSGNCNSIWICSGKIKNGADSCPTFAIYESDIKPILLDVFQETAGMADRYIDEYIDLYKTIDEDNDTAKAIAELEKMISFEQKKKAKLLDYNINGDISDKDYIKMNNEAIKKIEAAEAEKAELENKLSSETEFKKHLEEIRCQLEKAKEDAADHVIDIAFINQYIDKIYVSADGNTMQLNIKIFTGENCEKQLEKLRMRKSGCKKDSDSDFRSGQMLLKTNPQVHYHGADGLYGKYDEDTKKFCLYWGESKLYSNVDEALSKCFDSIKPLLVEEGATGSQRERDLTLFRDNIDFNNDDLENAILSYLNPDDPNYLKLEYRGVCLIGYDEDAYPKDLSGVEATIQSTIQNKISEFKSKISSRLKYRTPLDDFRLDIFLIPFSDVEEFRKKFLEVI